MKIRARHIATDTVVVLDYASIKAAKECNPYMTDFQAVGSSRRKKRVVKINKRRIK